MKYISIVGMGTGQDTLTPQGLRAIQGAQVLLGAPRVLALCPPLPQQQYPVYLPQEVAAIVAREEARYFAVVVSGDVGFYSASAGLAKALEGFQVEFVPGLSTVQVLFARLKLPWHSAAFVSVHGRGANVADTVRRSRYTLCLTGGNAGQVGQSLCRAGLGQVEVFVGENLGGAEESIVQTSAQELAGRVCAPLTVLLFDNPAYDDTIPCGLPDHRFVRRAGIPMTKSEVRAIVLSKLQVRPGETCWDVGAGTGSVTVELALAAYEGAVYAIEAREEAIPLLQENCAAFHLGNVHPVHGRAPAALADLPAPDVVFLGGSGGAMEDILAAALAKNPRARIVVTAVTVETQWRTLDALQQAGLSPELVQCTIARGERVGQSHLLRGQNPVTILWAGGDL